MHNMNRITDQVEQKFVTDKVEQMDPVKRKEMVEDTLNQLQELALLMDVLREQMTHLSSGQQVRDDTVFGLAVVALSQVVRPLYVKTLSSLEQGAALQGDPSWMTEYFDSACEALTEYLTFEGVFKPAYPTAFKDHDIRPRLVKVLERIKDLKAQLLTGN